MSNKWKELESIVNESNTRTDLHAFVYTSPGNVFSCSLNCPMGNLFKVTDEEINDKNLDKAILSYKEFI